MNLTVKKYQHAPDHWFIDDHVYFITGATYMKRRLLTSPESKEEFRINLFKYVEKYEYKLLEWVVLENHYHMLVRISNSEKLPRFINTLHKTSAYHIQRLLEKKIKPFWYQYWDLCIRNEKHYFETAMYILYNPVKHNIVDDLNNYPFSSFQNWKDEENENLKKLFIAFRPQNMKHYDEIDDF